MHRSTEALSKIKQKVAEDQERHAMTANVIYIWIRLQSSLLHHHLAAGGKLISIVFCSVSLGGAAAAAAVKKSWKWWDQDCFI